MEAEPVAPAATIDDEDNVDDDADNAIIGYQQNLLCATADDDLNFEARFAAPTANSIIVTATDATPALPASATVRLDDPPDPILLRCLAETYNHARSLSFAHANNGSMGCSANDRLLLFAYSFLPRTNVRLFDVGHHVHHPVCIGFL